MAKVNNEGNVVARCPGCHGANSTFEWNTAKGAYGDITSPRKTEASRIVQETYRLFRCAGCGRGGLGRVRFNCASTRTTTPYPGSSPTLLDPFFPEVGPALPVPTATPQGIQREFREAEACIAAKCYRAAAGLFRSVLDKTMKANGYKIGRLNLKEQVDLAAADGVITEARKRRAHEEIRVLGNDVLHDDWEEIDLAAVELAQHYAQRILEDFYDDRPAVLQQLQAKGRTPADAPAPTASLLQAPELPEGPAE